MLHLICSESVNISSVIYKESDHFVFINSGVLHCLKYRQKLPINSYVLCEDINILELNNEIQDSAEQIGYNKFVVLSSQHKQIVTWK